MMSHVSELWRFVWVYYGLFLLSRIRGVFRRVKQPRLRGEGWFFDTAVRPGFYEGQGQAILRRYYVRMSWPFLLDLPAFWMAYRTGNPLWLIWLMVLLVPVIHGNHMLNVAAAERAARPFAVEEGTQALAVVGLSLVPRRLRDFSDGRVEWPIGGVTVLAFAALVYLYRHGAGGHDARVVFWSPVLDLYLQFGVLLVKRVIVEWRSPVPLQQTEEHLQAREAMRRYYLRMCDWNRIAATTGIALWPVLLSLPAGWFEPLTRVWLWTWLVLCAAGAVWVEVMRKRLVDLRVQARPVRMPDLLGEARVAQWPVCFEPAAPMLILKSSRGYSLNLANTASYTGMAYLLGMGLLVMVARLHR